jgi:hypothetical protein
MAAEIWQVHRSRPPALSFKVFYSISLAMHHDISFLPSSFSSLLLSCRCRHRRRRHRRRAGRDSLFTCIVVEWPAAAFGPDRVDRRRTELQYLSSYPLAPSQIRHFLRAFAAIMSIAVWGQKRSFCRGPHTGLATTAAAGQPAC